MKAAIFMDNPLLDTHPSMKQPDFMDNPTKN